MKELFTIGHSNHSLDHFIELLLVHRLSMIADVRSSPYSKYSPHFNKDVLDNFKKKKGPWAEVMTCEQPAQSRRVEKSVF